MGTLTGLRLIPELIPCSPADQHLFGFRLRRRRASFIIMDNVVLQIIQSLAFQLFCPGRAKMEMLCRLCTKCFAAFAQEQYAEKVRQECLAAMERSTGREPEQPGDDLRLFMVNFGKNPARTSDPCVDLLAGRSVSGKMLPMVNGAFMGNAACMYSMAILACSPVMRQALDDFLHEYYQQDLSWGLDHLKKLLEAQKAKGDPAAEVSIRGSHLREGFCRHHSDGAVRPREDQ